MGRRPLADPAAVRAERAAIRQERELALMTHGARVYANAPARRRTVRRVVEIAGLPFRIDGAPRTKKNHGKVIWRKVKGVQTRFHVPSEAYQTWCASVVSQLFAAKQLPDRSYNCAAVFYRDADRGDAVGYYQGLADALQAAGVVSDDKLITQWDGSRLRVDRKNPRVELTLTPVEVE